MKEKLITKKELEQLGFEPFYNQSRSYVYHYRKINDNTNMCVVIEEKDICLQTLLDDIDVDSSGNDYVWLEKLPTRENVIELFNTLKTTDKPYIS